MSSQAVRGEWWKRSGWTWRDLWPLFRRTPNGFVLVGRWRYRRAGGRRVVVHLTADTSGFDRAMAAAARRLGRLGR
jgi:hypothetical protein